MGSKTAMATDGIGTVVETGLVELSAQRFDSAGRQFGMAATMCANAAGGRAMRLRPLPATPEAGFEREPRFSASLELGLRVLACFTPERPLWRIADIATELGSSRSTVHRYCITLVKLGQITQEGVAGRRYRRLLPDEEQAAAKKAAEEGVEEYVRAAELGTVVSAFKRRAVNAAVRTVTGEPA